MAEREEALPQALRDRLDAARDEWDVDLDWTPPGGPTAHGRAFGFWRVTVGPYGWREASAAYGADSERRRFGEPARAPVPVAHTVEGHDLSRALVKALDMADRRWPQT